METQPLIAKTWQVYERLLPVYGDHPLVPRRKPMHELISTMLSHRTTQHNEAVAYERMWQRFGTWEAIRDAPAGELAESDQPGQLRRSQGCERQGSLAADHRGTRGAVD